MLKIIKFPKIFKNHLFERFSSSWRYQFKIDKPIYYPKRHLSEEDELKVPREEQQKSNIPRAVGVQASSADYYNILGIDKVATSQDIKTAYYDLAKKFHPDAKPTPKETESFRKISEAYQVLSDESNRSQYDRFGVVINQIQPTITIGERSINAERNKKNILRFLNEQPTPKLDVKRVVLKETALNPVKNEVELTLTFLKAVHGSKEYVDLKAMVNCPRCHGATRLYSQANIEFCQKCSGTGQIRVKTDNFLTHKICDVCEGRKYVNKNSCKTCENRGLVAQSKRVEVHVPPGIANGDILSVTNPLNNQTVGVRLKVEKSNSHFKRDGNNIVSDKFITISQAVLGGKFKIRGLYEDLEVNLGPGIESHTTHCFKGSGIRTRSGLAGNHIVTFKIRIPKILNTKQRQLMLALSTVEDPTFDGQ